MTQLLNKKLLDAALINKKFFPFIHVNNIFLHMERSKDLLKDFPNINQGGSFNLSSDNKNSLNALVEDFESDEIKKILEKKFSINLNDSMVVPTLRGYSRSKDGNIHSDSKSKILTILIYLNKTWDHKNGLLRLLKSKDNLDDYIIEIPAYLGNMVIFKVTNNCWHGYKSFEGKRRSIQINYVRKSSQRFHLLRHSISSFFKKLKS
tara:strand:+ start:11245 stop:11862 length:618 start_codon:yes stop_codon:yes gene_type:complete